jgi:serine phosphatase RsbU (regulator of sigma subunit)
LWIFGIAFLLYILFANQSILHTLTQRQQKAAAILHEVRRNLTDRTRFVQAYTQTSERKYLQFYESILAIEQGKIPRPQAYERVYWDLMLGNGIKPRLDDEKKPLVWLWKEIRLTKEEKKRRQTLQNHAIRLQKLEQKAIDWVQQAAIKPKQANFFLDSARRYLYNLEYQQAQITAFQGADTLEVMLNQRLQSNISSLSENQSVVFMGLTALLLSGAISLSIGLRRLRRRILLPLRQAKKVAEQMSFGDFSLQIRIERQDEIGRILSSLQQLQKDCLRKAEFLQQIGTTTELICLSLKPSSPKDSMGLAIQSMHANLQLIQEHDRLLNWANEGYTHLATLFQQAQDLQTLADTVLPYVLQHLHIAIGGLFVLRKGQEFPYFELLSAYGYDRKRFLQKKFPVNTRFTETLLDRIYWEQTALYTLEIPPDYLEIKSGLGDAPPTWLWLVPLRGMDRLEGVLEIASWRLFEPVERTFIEKIAESIANMFALLGNYEQTRQLYKTLQYNQEEIFAQQEAIKQKNQALELINKQVQLSINAALTIQKAILPHKTNLDILLRDYFIIYRPKDVVSGDFYWVNFVEGKLIIIVADCTGHGIPGAFMTIVGKLLLDKIISQLKITTPAEILTQLHEEIRKTLKQQYNGNNYGMDAIVMTLEKPKSATKSTLTFCGAKNSLYYLMADVPTLQTLEGERKAIGGEQNADKHFRNYTLELPPKSLLYFGTDGLTDQNNAKRKNFGERKLKDLLEKNASAELSLQQQVIEQAITAHMQDTVQRDDILWMGLKIN